MSPSREPPAWCRGRALRRTSGVRGKLTPSLGWGAAHPGVLVPKRVIPQRSHAQRSGLRNRDRRARNTAGLRSLGHKHRSSLQDVATRRGLGSASRQPNATLRVHGRVGGGGGSTRPIQCPPTIRPAAEGIRPQSCGPPLDSKKGPRQAWITHGGTLGVALGRASHPANTKPNQTKLA